MQNMFLFFLFISCFFQFFFFFCSNFISFISQSTKLKKILIEELIVTTNITSFTAISILLFAGVATAIENRLSDECQRGIADPFKCCSSIPDSWYAHMKNPLNCTTYYLCEHGVPKLKICPSGTFWDSDADRCESKIPEEESGTEEEEDECNPVPVCKQCLTGIFPPDLCCKDAKTYHKLQLADGNDCSFYYQCVNGKAIHRQCPNGLYYSVNSDRCEWPDQSECKIKKNSGSNCPCGSTSKIVSEECLYGKVPSAKCCKEIPYWVEVLLQNNADCHTYIQCIHGKPVVKSCPDDLYYSATSNACVKIEDATCTS